MPSIYVLTEERASSKSICAGFIHTELPPSVGRISTPLGSTGKKANTVGNRGYRDHQLAVGCFGLVCHVSGYSETVHPTILILHERLGACTDQIALLSRNDEACSSFAGDIDLQ